MWNRIRMVCWLGMTVFALSSLAVGLAATAGGNTGLPALDHSDGSVVNHDVVPCVDFYNVRLLELTGGESDSGR